MTQSYTLRNVPFRVLRPTLAAFSTLVSVILSQAYTPDWTADQLAIKILQMKDKTDTLKNPTRRDIVVRLAAWYGLAQELRDVIQPTHPELAAVLDSTIHDHDWLEPAWEYMKGQMEQWTRNNSTTPLVG